MTKRRGNSVRRSLSRGADARGTSAVPDSGRDAYDKSVKSTTGTYGIEFVTAYEKATERDVELRESYGKSLISGTVGVPADMITMKLKKSSGQQTLTALDEVFYVYVGKQVYGKLSIRTQRVLRHTDLIFIYQSKARSPKPPRESYSRKSNYSKKSRSQISQTKRQSYRNRRQGRN